MNEKCTRRRDDERRPTAGRREIIIVFRRVPGSLFAFVVVLQTARYAYTCARVYLGTRTHERTPTWTHNYDNVYCGTPCELCGFVCVRMCVRVVVATTNECRLRMCRLRHEIRVR